MPYGANKNNNKEAEIWKKPHNCAVETQAIKIVKLSLSL